MFGVFYVWLGFGFPLSDLVKLRCCEINNGFGTHFLTKRLVSQWSFAFPQGCSRGLLRAPVPSPQLHRAFTLPQRTAVPGGGGGMVSSRPGRTVPVPFSRGRLSRTRGDGTATRTVPSWRPFNGFGPAQGTSRRHAGSIPLPAYFRFRRRSFFSAAAHAR